MLQGKGMHVMAKLWAEIGVYKLPMFAGGRPAWADGQYSQVIETSRQWVDQWTGMLATTDGRAGTMKGRAVQRHAEELQ